MPDGHRLAVEQPVAEAGGRLEGVTDGVSVVEHGAIARLALVSRHDRRLDGAALANRLGQRIGIAPEQPVEPRCRGRTQASSSTIIEYLTISANADR